MAAFRESIEYGNEVYYDYQCTHCEHEGRNKEASNYCQDCCVFMCEQCTKNHDTFPLNATHRLTDDTQFEAVQQPSLVWYTRHPARLVYCETHDTLCCTLCKVLEHSDCGRLLHLSEAIESVTDLIDNFISGINMVLDGRKADRSRIETEAHNACKSIKDFRSKINSYLDMLEKKSLDELETKRSAFIEKIGFDIDQLESTKMKTRKEREEFRSGTIKNEHEVFLKIRKCKKAITVSRGKIEDISKSLNKEILLFQTHSQIDEYLKSLSAIGSFAEVNACQTTKLAPNHTMKYSSPLQGTSEHTLCLKSSPPTAPDSLPCGASQGIVVSDVETSSQSKPDSATKTGVNENKSFFKEHVSAQTKENVNDVLTCRRDRKDFAENLNEDSFNKYGLSQITGFNVNEKSDRHKCNIFDICQLPDGTFLLTDAGNQKLKRFDQDYNLRGSLRLPGDPYCVCAAGPDQAVVSLRNQKKIQFIHVKKKLSLAKSFTVGDYCRGIAYVGGNLNVCVGDIDGKLTGRIEVYNNKGELQHYIPKAPRSITVFKYIVLCEISKCRFVTMYGCDRVAALDLTHNVTDYFDCDILQQPEGLCTDGEGQIFVCGYHNNKVVQISPKHKKFETILDENHGIQKPVAVYYVNDGVKKLLVSCANSDAVLIFELYSVDLRPQ